MPTTLADGQEDRRPARVEVSVHVGGLASADVAEAQLLQECATRCSSSNASAGSAAAAAAAAEGRISDRDVAVHVQVHEKCGHSVVRSLRDNGALDAMLRRYVEMQAAPPVVGEPVPVPLAVPLD